MTSPGCSSWFIQPDRPATCPIFCYPTRSPSVVPSAGRKRGIFPLQSLSLSLSFDFQVDGSTQRHQSKPLTKSHSREKGKSRNRNLHRKEREALLPRFFFLLDFDASRNPNFYSTNQQITWLESKISARNPSTLSAFFGFPSSDPSNFVQSIWTITFLWNSRSEVLPSLSCFRSSSIYFFPIWMFDCFYADSGLSAADCMLCVEW